MNLIRRKLLAVRRSAQKGFTLIELAIVGIFLGLLAVFAITSFSGSATDTTRANGLFEASTKIADNWALVAQSCGIGTDITAVDLTGGGATGADAAAANMNVLLGTTVLTGGNLSCFNSSGVRPLAGLAVAGSGGTQTIQGLPVVASNATVAGRDALVLTFGAAGDYAPDSLIKPLYNKYNAAGAAAQDDVPDAADTTDTVIRFGAKATRTLSIVKAL